MCKYYVINISDLTSLKYFEKEILHKDDTLYILYVLSTYCMIHRKRVFCPPQASFLSNLETLYSHFHARQYVQGVEYYLQHKYERKRCISY